MGERRGMRVRISRIIRNIRSISIIAERAGRGFALAALIVIALPIALSIALPFVHPVQAATIGVPLAAEEGGRSLLQNIALLIGILVLAATVLRIGLRRRPALRSGEPSPLGARSGASPAASAARAGAPAAELEAVLVQIQETGREIEARLDTKIRFAQRLLQESEVALGKLELARARATEAAERIVAGEMPRSPPPAVATASTATQSASAAGPSAAAASTAESRGKGSARGKKTAPAGAPAAAGPSALAKPATPVPAPQPAAAPRPRPVPPEQRSQERIRALAAEGRDAKQIAREVGRPIGEVQLIIALARGEGPEPPPAP